MDLLRYTVEQVDFRARLRVFLAREVTPCVDRWEAEGIVPHQIWRRMGQEGFLCPCLPAEYGGLGGDFRYAVIVAEELAATRHTGLAANLHSDVVVPYIAAFGSEALRRRYLPGCASGEIVTAIAMTEPGAGSDLAAMQTAAREEGDTVVLEGAKTFISNGINADLVVVAARHPEIPDPYAGISLYLVESGTPGFTRGRRLKKMGWHSQDTAELFFSGCRIPAGNRLGERGMGFRMLMEKLQQERLMCAVAAAAVAERICAWTTDYCRATQPCGKPLSRSQANQFALVEMATEARLGRTFVDKLVLDHMAGETLILETVMAKFWTTDMVRRVAERSLDLVGQEAMLERCPMVRAWRDVRVMAIFAGTNEIMKGIAAKCLGF
jgi:alkylation response protein AidB-like acyl-CoA dehydrogenase